MLNKHLTAGMILQRFADDEFDSLYVFRKDAKNVWSVNDPISKDNVNNQGKC